jgi:hypothetical protein
MGADKFHLFDVVSVWQYFHEMLFFNTLCALSTLVAVATPSFVDPDIIHRPIMVGHKNNPQISISCTYKL